MKLKMVTFQSLQPRIPEETYESFIYICIIIVFKQKYTGCYADVNILKAFPPPIFFPLFPPSPLFFKSDASFWAAWGPGYPGFGPWLPRVRVAKLRWEPPASLGLFA